MERPEGFDIVQRPKHYNAHPSGVECIEIAEYMGFNLGNAFKYLWRAGLKAEDSTQDLEKALWYLRRFDEQKHPIPRIGPSFFREVMATRRQIFNRPSPWCESVRHSLAAICDLCSNPEIKDACRLTAKAIRCTEQALEDERCLGRGQQP